MALVTSSRSRLWPEKSTFWNDWPAERSWVWRDRFDRDRDWEDWPMDWPRPREIYDRFRGNNSTARWWNDWPSYWPRFDTVLPRFTTHLDRFDNKWRDDPFWRDLYPRWAEPIFKDGIDVKTHITNDDKRFSVEIDTYQFKPEELQVKALDDTLLIEGRHEDVKDRDNYTKMYFVRKYQLPYDVDAQTITSSVDNSGRLMVEALKRYQPIEGRERPIPIESSAQRRATSRSSSYSRDHDSGRGSANDYRSESRANNGGFDQGYLSPTGYRTAFEARQTDGGGLRHEARREQFREEVRRGGSQQAIPIPVPLSPIRTESRQSGSFHRSASSSRNEFRNEGHLNGDHLLRPSEELGGNRMSSSEERTIRINRS